MDKLKVYPKGLTANDEWDVVGDLAEEVMIERQPSFGRYERNIQKFQQVKEFWDEFNERSILVKQSIGTLTEELKVDLTIKFTKFIQMQHYEALNKAYTIEDFGSKSELS